MNPRISVVLPVYNGEAWLRSCIQSVLDQTFTDFELIVGDDASTDRSPEILSEFRDPRLRVYRGGTNVGLFKNLNRLLKEVHAPLVRFFCQDDLLEPSCLAQEVSLHESRPDLVLSICQATEIDARGDRIVDWTPEKTAPIFYEPAVSLQLLLFHGCIAGNLSTVCVRRRWLEQVGGFNEECRLAGDYDLLVQLCRRGVLADMQQILVRIRRHSGRLSLSEPARVGFVRETRKIREGLIPLLSEEIRSYAVRYTYWRQNVLDTHGLLRTLFEGRFLDCKDMAKIMGLRDLTAGVALWLITLNNRLYKPKPRFHNA